MEVVSDSGRPARPRFYAVAGRLLFVQCENPQLAEHLDRLFAGWLLAPVDPTTRQPHVTISCYCDGITPVLDRGLDHFAIADGGVCYTSGESFSLDLGNSIVQLSSGTTINLEIYLKKLPDFPDANFAHATSFAICAGLRRHGVFELHAAGMTTPDQTAGALIVGYSGSGKSTLTANLAASGWHYLSDDEVLLIHQDDGVSVRGFRSFFALSAETLRTFGVETLSNLATKPATAGYKVCFEPAAIFDSKQISETTPRALFFTRVSEEQETRIVKLTRTATMSNLLRACPWATYDQPVAAQYLRALSELARQSNGFELNAGRDLLSPGRAAEILLPYALS